MAARVGGNGWGLRFRPKFEKAYRRLDKQIQTRVDEATRTLGRSNDPAKLGEYKKQYRVFAYPVGRKYRVIYSVDPYTGTIDFLSVCDHKSVYMKD